MPLKSINFSFSYHFAILIIVSLSLSISTKTLKAETLRIAVASNFLKTAQSLAQQFEAQSQHSIKLSSGSSGKLYLQISRGAPFDLFLSADKDKPQLLIKQGFAIPNSIQTYAIGKLVLWMKSCDTSQGMAYLNNPSIKKIAMANPKLAPYGMATEQLLKENDLWLNLNPKMIFPENISQVSQMVKIGVVDAAFIANSQRQLIGFSQHHCLIDIPRTSYPPIEQQLVIISNSKQKALAEEFVGYLKSENAQDLIKNMGYFLAESDKMPVLK